MRLLTEAHGAFLRRQYEFPFGIITVQKTTIVLLLRISQKASEGGVISIDYSRGSSAYAQKASEGGGVVSMRKCEN